MRNVVGIPLGSIGRAMVEHELLLLLDSSRRVKKKILPVPETLGSSPEWNTEDLNHHATTIIQERKGEGMNECGGVALLPLVGP